MIFDVPVAYSVYGKVRGSRVSSTVGFIKTIAYDIPEVSGDEAPIIAAWNDERPEHADDAYSSYSKVIPYIGKEHVRHKDGLFWRPLRIFEAVQDSEKKMDVIDTKDFAAVLRSSKAEGIKLWQNHNTKASRQPDKHFAHIEKTNLDFASREVSRYLSRLAVIDGMLYIRCDRPMIILSQQKFLFDQGPGKGNIVLTYDVTRVITLDRDESFHLRRMFYPVQRFDEALKRARRANGGAYTYPDNIPLDKHAINALNMTRKPEFSDFYACDEDEVQAEECLLNLKKFAFSVERDRNRLLPAGDHIRLRLFCDLLSAMESFPDPSAFEILEEAGREYLARYEVYEEHNHPEQIALKRAIEIAENRTVFVNSEAFSLWGQANP